MRSENTKVRMHVYGRRKKMATHGVILGAHGHHGVRRGPLPRQDPGDGVDAHSGFLGWDGGVVDDAGVEDAPGVFGPTPRQAMNYDKIARKIGKILRKITHVNSTKGRPLLCSGCQHGQEAVAVQVDRGVARPGAPERLLCPWSPPRLRLLQPLRVVVLDDDLEERAKVTRDFRQ